MNNTYSSDVDPLSINVCMYIFFTFVKNISFILETSSHHVIMLLILRVALFSDALNNYVIIISCFHVEMEIL